MAEREFCQWLSDILLRITHFSAAGSCDNQVPLPAVPGILLRTTDFGTTENGVHGLEFSPILTFLELLKATNNLLTFALSALQDLSLGPHKVPNVWHILCDIHFPDCPFKQTQKTWGQKYLMDKEILRDKTLCWLDLNSRVSLVENKMLASKTE